MQAAPQAEPASFDTPPLRCVIVEDHLMFTQLLVTMLRAVPGLNLEIVAAVDTAANGIAACVEHEPDLLILDLALGDARGETVAERLLEVNPRAKLIVLSGHASTFVCPPSICRSIHAVIDKTDAFDSLQMVLAKLVGLPSATPASRDRLARQLSHREQEVLLLVGQGLQSKEIAARLNITRNTVQSHRKKIAMKLGTEGAELSRYAYRFWQQVTAGTRVGS